MAFGDSFKQAWDGATATARAAADRALTSASAAAEAVAQGAKRAADTGARAAAVAKEAAVSGAMAVKDGVVAGAKWTQNAAIAGATAVKDGAVAVGRGTANVAGFGVRAVGETAIAAGKGALAVTDTALSNSVIAGAPYRAAKKLLSPTAPPRERVTEPCLDTVEGKRQRLERRQALIAGGSSPGATAAQRAAAARLARNNDAVELARLSDDTYAQYNRETPPDHSPPLGWTKLDKSKLKEHNISQQFLDDSKAVIYQTPTDWPGGQKTVLAFRGTEPSDIDDLKTNADQALGLSTVQYQAAVLLGEEVAKQFGQDTLVTGHSLGGGKAQAAGASGGLNGSMFNSAGLNPITVDGTMPSADQFLQFRAPFDPLTGIQNSAALQTGVAAAAGGLMPFSAGMSAGDFINQKLGLPPLGGVAELVADRGTTAFPLGMANLLRDGNVLPPAQGRVIGVPSFDAKGVETASTDLGGQHSVKNMINGIEREKSEDVATLQQ